MKIQTHLLYISLLIIVLLFGRNQCTHIHSLQAQLKDCQEQRLDTTNHVHDEDSTPLYEPEMSMVITGGKIPGATEKTFVKNPVHTPAPQLGFTLENPESLSVATPDLPETQQYFSDPCAEYHAVRDVRRVKWGTITLVDTLHENRVYKRQIFTDFQVPVETRYIPSPPSTPPAIRLYLGFHVQGTRSSLFTAVGPSASVQTRSGTIYQFGAFASRQELIYQAGLQIPIH